MYVSVLIFSNRVLTFTQAKLPNDQSPMAVPASSMLSPPRSQDAEGSLALPASASTTPSQVPATLPPARSGDGADKRPAKHVRVNNWNQASFGPASRTKRRRLAEQQPSEDGPDDCEVKHHNHAVSTVHKNARTPPPDTSRDEGVSSVKPTLKQREVPSEDDSALVSDQAEDTTLVDMNTPQSMVEKDGSRPFAASSVASPFATFSTSAASSGRELSAEKEMGLGMSGISGKRGLEEVDGNADDDDDAAVIEGLIRGEGLEDVQVGHDGYAPNDASTASPTIQLSAQDDPPESTIKRAILSLQPNERLTTTCIESLIRIFNPGDLRILDPAYIDCENPLPKPALGISPNKTLLIPLHHRDGHGHWTLAAVVNNITAYFYNSWISLKYDQQAWKALDVFCRSQSSVPESHPKLVLRSCVSCSECKLKGWR